MSAVGYFTPLRFVGKDIPNFYKLKEFVDSYFYFGGRIAIVNLKNNEIHFITDRVSWLQAAIKIATYIPLIVFYVPQLCPPIAKPILFSKPGQFIALLPVVMVVLKLKMPSSLMVG